jgi:Lipase (class 3)
MQDGNQIVISIRGSDLTNLANLIANISHDRSWATLAPNAALVQDVVLAAKFIASVKAAHPNANLMLTGHSLGGGIAQVLGEITGLPTVTFNTPGMSQFEPFFLKASGFPTSIVGIGSGANGANISNYRVHGDLVSLAGTPIGQEITLSTPSLTRLFLHHCLTIEW